MSKATKEQCVIGGGERAGGGARSREGLLRLRTLEAHGQGGENLGRLDVPAGAFIQHSAQTLSSVELRTVRSSDVFILEPLCEECW